MAWHTIIDELRAFTVPYVFYVKKARACRMGFAACMENPNCGFFGGEGGKRETEEGNGAHCNTAHASIVHKVSKRKTHVSRNLSLFLQ